jgi:outer membrane protein assembly factor BamB
MKLPEKYVSTLKIISQIAGIFALVVAITMIFSLVQLKTIDPLDNPALLELKEQYDSDPDNANLAEQIRAMDLMARKAYFATRRQIEIGSYLLLAGAVVFIFCQRLITGDEKVIPSVPGEKPDPLLRQKRGRQLLLISASVITVGAIVSSFLLRNNLPELRVAKQGKTGSGLFANIIKRSTRSSSEPSGEDYTIPAENFIPHETNFPFFRGQDGHGIAGGSGYPTEWDGEQGTNIKWKLRIPKYGKSSPVIWGDKLFITGAEGTVGEVYCIDKNSGEILWSVQVTGIEGEPEELPEMDMEAGLAVPTAATNGKAVCAIFANGNLICLDMDGNKMWALNVGSLDNVYGYSCSLIIYQNTLIVQHDSNERLSMMGFDINTGNMIWETARQGLAVWSSPVLASFGDKSQVIINGSPDVTSFDAETGEELWSVECQTGDVAPSLAVNSTMVYSNTDYSRLAAIKPGPGASIVWEDNYFTSDVSSPVANNSYLFIATGYGDVACYNAQTGDTLWTHYFMEQYYASPIIADDMVYLLDRSGTTNITKAAGTFELISVSPLGEPVDCTPAFSDKKIYIRGMENLYCISQE